MVIVTLKTSHWLPAHLRVYAITLGRTIYCVQAYAEPRLLVHECQHVRQWVEAGRSLFLAKYLADYLRGRLSGDKHPAAYLGIGFEEEAREMAERYATWREWSDGERWPIRIESA